MAIDILTRGTATPIVVGDVGDMKRYSRCSIQRADSNASMKLSSNLETGAAADDALSTTISEVAAINCLQSEFVLLVGLSKSDDITSAFLVPMNDFVSPVRELTEHEIKKLAEDLVSGDFQLDFLR